MTVTKALHMTIAIRTRTEERSNIAKTMHTRLIGHKGRENIADTRSEITILSVMLTGSTIVAAAIQNAIFGTESLAEKLTAKVPMPTGFESRANVSYRKAK